MNSEETRNPGIAVYDRDRQGIFIHRDQLLATPFAVGDRFRIHRGKRDLFSLRLDRDAAGDIVFDKNGIFIRRNRRVDILLGGLFEEYRVGTAGDAPQSLIIRPLSMVSGGSAV